MGREASPGDPGAGEVSGGGSGRSAANRIRRGARSGREAGGRAVTGKHSLADQSLFWRSLVLFALKWSLLLSLPILAGWGVWRLVQEPEEPRRGPVAVPVSPRGASPSPSPPLAPSPSPSPEPSPAEEPPPQRGGRIQVLNGTPAQGLGAAAAKVLRQSGYQVVAVQTAARHYEQTTVFFQPGNESMAADVAGIMQAAAVRPAPGTVSAAIPVTVVVGADFRR